VRAALEAFYGWYRDNRAMVVQIQRDRNLIPALDMVVSESTDAPLGELAAALAQGFGSRGRRAAATRTLIRIALDFWTWRRLDLEGLGYAQAARLMADAVAGVAVRA
jgi:hypothetical protein